MEKVTLKRLRPEIFEDNNKNGLLMKQRGVFNSNFSVNNGRRRSFVGRFFVSRPSDFCQSANYWQEGF